MLNFFIRLYQFWFTGLKFWKVPSRKIYGVLISQLNKGKSPARKKSVINLDSDTSSDFESQPLQKIRKSDASLNHDIMNELQQMRNELQSALQITKYMKLPPGIYLLIINTFRCTICLNLIVPPVIFARCCKNILGCEGCVNVLYKGENGPTTKCPMCRAEHAFSETCRINGLGDFLSGLSPLFKDSDEEPNNSLSPAPLPQVSDDDFDFP